MRFHVTAPSLAKTVLVTLVSVTVLSACQTNSRAGKGNLNLSDSTKRGLQAYMDQTFPTIFAASINGRGYSYYFCETGGCRDTVSTYQKVLDNCEERSKSTCRLLATSRNIVWKKDNGEAYTLEELYGPAQPRMNMDIATLGALALCKTAYNPKQRDWYLDKAAAPHISEIQSRGMTKEFCAKMLSGSN